MYPASYDGCIPLSGCHRLIHRTVKLGQKLAGERPLYDDQQQNRVPGLLPPHHWLQWGQIDVIGFILTFVDRRHSTTEPEYLLEVKR